jgi:hypothetical protein
MKIELKNIHHSPSLSEETEAFTANLYINDIHAGYAKNQGHGGPTDYDWHDERGRKLIAEAEAYCKALPPEKFEMDGKQHFFEMNLEQFIDNLLSRHLDEKELQKFRKKIDKAMEFGIVIGVPDQSFGVLKFKSPIDMILVHPKGADILKDTIVNKVLPSLKEDEKILNTNIPETILKGAGLSERQYVPQQQQKEKKVQQKKKGRGI